MENQASININNRKSNFELLRIISMLMIIGHHLVLHSDFCFSTVDVYITTGQIIQLINSIWITFLKIIGKVGVDIFILISGYFLINLNIKKLLKIVFQAMFYSIVLYCTTKYNEIFRDAIIQNIIAPLDNWWFIQTYFVLCFLSPFINRLLKSLNKNEYILLLIVLFMINVIQPTLGLVVSNFDRDNVSTFIFLYALGRYIKLYSKNYYSKKKLLIICAFVLLTTVFLNVVEPIVASYIDYSSFFKPEFAKEGNLFVITISVIIFIIFKQIDIKSNMLINTISKTTLGVYLIHEYNYLREIIWIKMFKNNLFQNSPFLIPYSILQIFIVFVLCSIIEYIREILIENRIDGIFSKISDLLNIYLNKIINKIS